MRAGVIVNVSAGNFKYIKEKITKLKKVFDGIITGPGRFGGDFLGGTEAVEVVSENFTGAIKELTLKLSRRSDVIVSVGGDGTANFVASALIDENLDIPIMGIAGGTANVGPLVRFSFEDLEKTLYVDSINCLKIWKGNQHLGYAFVDAVFGDTFLGTLNGKMVNLSAKAFLESSRKIEKKPVSDIVEDLVVLKNKKKMPVNIKKVSQIVASPLNFSGFYIGKAVTGSLSWASFFDSIGILSISNRVIIDSFLEERDVEKSIVIEQILFSEKDTIEISGIKEGVYVVLDGNPICYCDSPIRIQGLKNCVKVLLGSSKSGWPIGWKNENK